MDIGITVAHGICVDTFPLLIDVFVGKYFDQCHVRFQNRQIARCSNGTKLYYNLSPPSSHSSRIKLNSPPLYDFHQEGSFSLLFILNINYNFENDLFLFILNYYFFFYVFLSFTLMED